MADEKQICCCGARSWTRVIAWIQIIGNALMLVGEIAALVAIIAIANANTEEKIDPKDKKSFVIVSFVVVAVALLLDLVGFVMGIILLKGSKQKNTSYLQAWLIYAIIALVFAVISGIIGTLGGVSSGALLGSNIFGIAFTVIVNGFAIWVVRVHIREIDQSKYGGEP